MQYAAFDLATLRRSLGEGWRVTAATWRASGLYALVFVAGGAAILGGLLALGWTPFAIAAAGAFMLLGPALLAGFFGIAAAHEAGQPAGLAAVVDGFREAAGALWALALVCGLLFMIFVTDAAMLYAYMVGGDQAGIDALLPASAGVGRFVLWSAVSGAFIAFLLFCVSAFSVPLLAERRAGLVEAVAASVKVVFGNFAVAMAWGALMAAAIIVSIVLLPLLAVTLPWLAHAGRALYRAVLPR